MIFAVVGLAWLLSALVVGSLFGRCVSSADRRREQELRGADAPLYVADILRAHAAATQR